MNKNKRSVSSILTIWTDIEHIHVCTKNLTSLFSSLVLLTSCNNFIVSESLRAGLYLVVPPDTTDNLRLGASGTTISVFDGWDS